ncbi:MAG TPA: type VI secretion system-associated protein TagO [Longimicrobiaceae bacterium]|nr:type VI secretion system-associated protein TagO [Longimicrobiaceae bacterium]
MKGAEWRERRRHLLSLGVLALCAALAAGSDDSGSGDGSSRDTVPETDTSYIAIDGATGGAPAAEADTSGGAWRVTRGRSPMDDSPTVVLTLLAGNTLQGSGETHRPVLHVRCLEDRTEVFVVTGTATHPEAGLDNEFTIRLRLDEKPPQRERWTGATDGKGLFAPRSIALARQLMVAERLRFQLTPAGARTQIVEFDVRGLHARLGEVAEACHWRL